MTDILYGKPVAEELGLDLKQRIERLKEKGNVPTLAIIRVGDSESDISYEKGIVKRAQALGITVNRFNFDKEVPRDELIHKISMLNEDDDTHGVMLFRPLSGTLNAFEREIVDAIDPRKDVDGATKISLAGVMLNEETFAPCTPEACMAIFDHYGIDLTGKNVTVIGRSAVVGRPLSLMLANRNATVTICHTKTRDIGKIAQKADILVTAAGKAGLVDSSFVRAEQIVVDVSVNFDQKTGKMTGDVTADAAPTVSAITPVPGGVGAVTTMILMRHTVLAAENALSQQ